MRKNYFSLFLLFSLNFFAAKLNAQVFYTLHSISGTYTALTGGTAITLSGGTLNDGWTNVVPIGFNFYYNSAATPTTQLTLSTNGFAALGVALTASTPTNSMTSGPFVAATRPVLAPLWDDLSVTSMSYLTTGEAPNRICTIEWTGARFNRNAAATNVNFQVKLYETANAIDFVYDSVAAPFGGGASIGITALAQGAGNFLSLQNATAAPTTSTTVETSNINRQPATGQIYRFEMLGPPIVSAKKNPLCVGDTIVLTAEGMVGATFSWTGPGLAATPGATLTIPNITLANVGTYSVTQTVGASTSAPATITINIDPSSPPLPDISVNSPVCVGNPIMFTVNNFSPAFTYSWTGPNGFTSPVADATISYAALSDAGDYSIASASYAGCITHNTIHVAVNDTATNHINISVTPNDTVCVGDNISFVAQLSYGGTAPQFQWVKNGLWIWGATDSTYGSPYLMTFDTISCIVTSNGVCVLNANDTGDAVAIYLATQIVPTTTLTASQDLTLPGAPINFYANTLNAGPNPVYEWYKNGVLQPAYTGPSYTAYNLTVTGDYVKVIVRSSFSCATPDTAYDDWGNINVLPLSVSRANAATELMLYPNPNNGDFVVAGPATGKSASVEVLNTLGQVVFSKELAVENNKFSQQVTLGKDMPAGAYTLRLHTATDNKVLHFTINGK